MIFSPFVLQDSWSGIWGAKTRLPWMHMAKSARRWVHYCRSVVCKLLSDIEQGLNLSPLCNYILSLLTMARPYPNLGGTDAGTAGPLVVLPQGACLLHHHRIHDDRAAWGGHSGIRHPTRRGNDEEDTQGLPGIHWPHQGVCLMAHNILCLCGNCREASNAICVLKLIWIELWEHDSTSVAGQYLRLLCTNTFTCGTLLQMIDLNWTKSM